MTRFQKLVSKYGDEQVKASANDIEKKICKCQKELIEELECRVSKLEHKLKLVGVIDFEKDDIVQDVKPSLRPLISTTWSAETYIREIQSLKLAIIEAKKELEVARETMNDMFC